MWNTPQYQSKKKKSPHVGGSVWRVRLLFFFLFFAGTLVLARLFFLQVLSHEKWIALAENQHNASLELAADRGEIFMHDGENDENKPAQDRVFPNHSLEQRHIKFRELHRNNMP